MGMWLHVDEMDSSISGIFHITFFFFIASAFFTFQMTIPRIKNKCILNAERLCWCARFSSCDWIKFIEQIWCVGFEYYATSIRWHQTPRRWHLYKHSSILRTKCFYSMRGNLFQMIGHELWIPEINSIEAVM